MENMENDLLLSIRNKYKILKLSKTGSIKLATQLLKSDNLNDSEIEYCLKYLDVSYNMPIIKNYLKSIHKTFYKRNPKQIFDDKVLLDRDFLLIELEYNYPSVFKEYCETIQNIVNQSLSEVERNRRVELMNRS